MAQYNVHYVADQPLPWWQRLLKWVKPSDAVSDDGNNAAEQSATDSGGDKSAATSDIKPIFGTTGETTSGGAGGSNASDVSGGDGGSNNTPASGGNPPAGGGASGNKPPSGAGNPAPADNADSRRREHRRQLKLAAVIIVLVAVLASILVAYGVIVGKEAKEPNFKLIAFARSVILLAGLAAGCVGALAGFLFGIPRAWKRTTVTTNEKHENGKPKDQVAATSAAADLEWRPAPSNSLEEVVEWLTKVLIGAGLVGLNKLPESLALIGTNINHAVKHSDVGVLTQAVAVIDAVCGFLAAYLWTRISYTAVQTQADQSLFAELSNIRNLAVSADNLAADVAKMVKQILTSEQDGQANGGGGYAGPSKDSPPKSDPPEGGPPSGPNSPAGTPEGRGGSTQAGPADPAGTPGGVPSGVPGGSAPIQLQELMREATQASQERQAYALAYAREQLVQRVTRRGKLLGYDDFNSLRNYPLKTALQVIEFANADNKWDDDTTLRIFSSQPFSADGYKLSVTVGSIRDRGKDDRGIYFTALVRRNGRLDPGPTLFLLHPSYKGGSIRSGVLNQQTGAREITFEAVEDFMLLAITNDGKTLLSIALGDLPGLPDWFRT